MAQTIFSIHFSPGILKTKILFTTKIHENNLRKKMEKNEKTEQSNCKLSAKKGDAGGKMATERWLRQGKSRGKWGPDWIKTSCCPTYNNALRPVVIIHENASKINKVPATKLQTTKDVGGGWQSGGVGEWAADEGRRVVLDYTTPLRKCACGATVNIALGPSNIHELLANSTQTTNYTCK